MNRKLLVAVPTLALSLAAPAWAQEFEEGGKLYAIQNRKYVIAHEFTLGIGTVPLDAFYKGVTGSFSYTYHFGDLWAWELVNAAYSLNLDTSLKKDLEANFGVKPTQFPELKFLVNTNLVWKPLYGKAVFLNETLLYGELYLTVGPALSKYENTDGAFVGLNAGLGFRLYLSKNFAIRAEVRDYEFVSPTHFSDNKNELFLQLGIGLNIR